MSGKRHFWLMKSEPDVYPFSRLLKEGHAFWDGVRNHTAKLNLMAMKKDDLAFFYHSNIGKEIVGIMRIKETAHPDPSDEAGRFVQVGVEPVEEFAQPVTLEQIKSTPTLSEMILLKQSRLSVQPVRTEEWKIIEKMGKG